LIFLLIHEPVIANILKHFFYQTQFGTRLSVLGLTMRKNLLLLIL